MLARSEGLRMQHFGNLFLPEVRCCVADGVQDKCIPYRKFSRVVKTTRGEPAGPRGLQQRAGHYILTTFAQGVPSTEKAEMTAQWYTVVPTLCPLPQCSNPIIRNLVSGTGWSLLSQWRLRVCSSIIDVACSYLAGESLPDID